MDIQTRKIEFIQAFLKLQNSELITLFENLLNSETSGDFKPMSLEQLNDRIDTSEQDFKDGNYKSHKDVFDKYE